MNKHYFPHVLASLTAWASVACNPSADTQDGLVRLDLHNYTEIEDFQPVEKLMRDVEIVALDDHDESGLVKYGSTFCMTDNRIVVLDHPDGHGKILLFDRNGKFVRAGKNGNGPGEFNNIKDVTVDAKTGNILVAQSGIVSVFDEDLNLIRDIKDNLEIDAFDLLDGKFVALTRGAKVNVYAMDADLNVEQKYDLYSIYPFVGFSRQVKTTKDGAIVMSAFNDTLFLYSGGALSPKYVLDYPMRQQLAPNGMALTLDSSKGFLFCGSYFQAGDVQSYFVVGMDKTLFGYRNNINGHSVKFCASSSSSSEGIIPNGIDGNRFVSVLTYEMVEKNINILRRVLSPEQFQKVEALDEDSNPILVFYRIDV